MTEEIKVVTREELYAAVWSTPLSKLAPSWGAPIQAIVKACETLNVPQPDSAHWTMLRRGVELEKTLLPTPDAKMPTSVGLEPPQKRVAKPKVEEEEAAPPPGKPKYEVAPTLENAHRLIRQTYKALTGDTYLHNGAVNCRTEHPLNVSVSPEQVERACRILDAIIKPIVEQGGHFERQRDYSLLLLFIGKQPIRFWITEAMKRKPREYSQEEREAKGFWLRDKYDWSGSGFLRFNIGGDKDVFERRWEESKRVRLEDKIDEIVAVVLNAEKQAEEIRAQRAARERLAAQEQQHRDREWRRERQEKEHRENLGKKGGGLVQSKTIAQFHLGV